ncbi:MAG: PEP-CTERM sorting domain-containing protein, partial [Nitrospirales bacterium]
MKHSLYNGILLSALCLASFATQSNATSYDIEWAGANGYSMTGMFNYSNTLTGIINGTQIDSLSIEGFKDGASVGTWDTSSVGTSSSTLSNFNFDTSTGTFLTGGRSDSNSGQGWNVPNFGGFGFFSGNSSQGLYVNGSFESQSLIIIGSTVNTTALVPSTLKAILNPGNTTSTPGDTIPNPEPSTILLVGTGIIGLFAHRLRKQRVI